MKRLLLVGCGAEIGSMIVGMLDPAKDGMEVAAILTHPAEGDPRLWAVFDDRLYFFYSEENMQEFSEAPTTIVSEAQETWDRLFPF